MFMQISPMENIVLRKIIDRRINSNTLFSLHVASNWSSRTNFLIDVHFPLVFIETIYDPLSSKQTNNLVKVIEHICRTYPTMNDDSKIVNVKLQKKQKLREDRIIVLCSRQCWKLLWIVSNNRSTTIFIFHFTRKNWSSLDPQTFQRVILWKQRPISSFDSIGQPSNFWET